MQVAYNNGIDILKILSCVGVLIYHTFDPHYYTGAHNDVVLSFHFLASFCVPMFFVLNGWTVFQHSSISMEYIESRCYRYMKLVLGWGICYWLYDNVFLGGTFGFDEIIGSFIGKGPMGVFWFVGCLIIIHIFFAILLAKQYRKNQTYNKVIFCIGCFITGIKCLIILYPENKLCSYLYWLPQWAWIYLYGVLFAAAPLLESLRSKFNIMCPLYIQFVLMIVAAGVFLYSSVWLKGIAKFTLTPADMYCTPLWWIYIALIYCVGQTTGEVLETNLHIYARSTLVVYAVHIPVLNIMKNFMMIDSAFLAVGIVLFLFIVGHVLSVPMRELPILRHLT